MLSKISFLLLSTACLCLLANSSEAQKNIKPGNEDELTKTTNICQVFSDNAAIDGQTVDPPAPVRRLVNEDISPVALTSTESEFYQDLGMFRSHDGSYTCMALDPDNARRRFTLFKVTKIDGVVVISSFLNKGEFLSGQQEAITNLFLEMISFYTDIPTQYYVGIKRYFQEFYLRIEDGRIKPSSTQVYLVDEPEATVILYHPLQGSLKGTGLSLNIPLN